MNNCKKKSGVSRKRPHSRRSRAVPCRVECAQERVVIELDEDVHGVAPGQTACFMEGDRVVGYGTIASAS